MHSFRIGRVFGIELRVDWSVAVIFWLLTWQSATLALPSIAPGYGVAEYWVVSAIATALFIVTLTAHELSHSLAARRRGISVRDITLWMLGGIATIEGIAQTPHDDLAIALAGPAASATIGCAGIGLGVAAAAIGVPGVIIGGILWVAVINLTLAVFNMVPAAPLDGGRVLRAWLWHRGGNRAAATIKAAHAGRAFAWILIVAGFAEFAAGGAVGGLWLIVLGWFVQNVARAEERQEVIERDLGGVRVRDVMTPHPMTAPDSETVARLVDDFTFGSHGSAFPLRGADGRISGLVTLTQCKQVPRQEREHVLARDIAKPIAEVPKAAPDDLILDALHRAAAIGPRLLVLEHEDLVGIVTPTDVMRILQRTPPRRAATVSTGTAAGGTG